MVNKNKFRITNDKKILHKIGKHWVVLSAMAIALLGGGAIAGTTTAQASADEASQPKVVVPQSNNAHQNAANDPKAIEKAASQNNKDLLNSANLNISNNQNKIMKLGSVYKGATSTEESDSPSLKNWIYDSETGKYMSSDGLSYNSDIAGNDATDVNGRPSRNMDDSKHYYGFTFKYFPNQKAIEFTGLPDGWRHGDLSNFINEAPGNNNTPKAIFYAQSIKFNVADGSESGNPITNTNSMFYMDSNVHSIEFTSNFNTSNVTDMHNMFQGDSGLKSLDLSTDKNFNTSNVKDMHNMFIFGGSLSSLTLSSDFDTGNSKDMSHMFGSDKSLVQLKVPQTFINGINNDQRVNMTSIFSDVGTPGTPGANFSLKVKDSSGSYNPETYINIRYIDSYNNNVVGDGAIFSKPGENGSTGNVYDHVGIPQGYAFSKTHKNNPSDSGGSLSSNTDDYATNITYTVGKQQTINIYVNPSESINYVYTDKNNKKYNEGSAQEQLSNGSYSSSWNGSAGLSSGWHTISPSVSFTYGVNNSSVNVPVDPNSAKVQYTYNNGTTDSMIANDSADFNTFSASNSLNSAVSSDNAKGLPSGWHLTSQSTPISFNSNTNPTVDISPNTINEHVSYNIVTSGYDNPGSTVASYSTGLNDNRAAQAGNNSLSITSSYAPSLNTNDYTVSSAYTLSHSTDSSASAFSDVTYVTPNSESETVNYIYNDKSTVADINNGYYGKSSSVTSVSAGWSLSSGASTSFTFGLGNKSINVNVVPSNVAYDIKYMSGDSNVSNASYEFSSNDYMASANVSGFTNNEISLSSGNLSNIPSGYQLASSNNIITYSADNHTYCIDVTPRTVANANATVHYVVDDNNGFVKHGQTLNSNIFSGKQGISFTIGANPTNLPNGYSIENQNQNLTYNNGSYNITIKPKLINDQIHYQVSGNGVENSSTTSQGYYGNQGSVTAPNGYHFVNNSTGQFTYGADGGVHTFDVAKNTTTPTSIPNSQPNVPVTLPTPIQPTSSESNDVISNSISNLGSMNQSIPASTNSSRTNSVNHPSHRQSLPAHSKVTNKGFVVTYGKHGHDIVTYHGHKYAIHYNNNGKNTIRVKRNGKYRNVVIGVNKPVAQASPDVVRAVDMINFNGPVAKHVFTAKGFNKAMRQLPAGQVIKYHGRKIARLELPLHWRYFMVTKNALAHFMITSIGRVTTRNLLSARHTYTIFIKHIVAVHGRKANYVRYEFSYKHHDFWVTARKDFVPNSYLQEQDFETRHSNYVRVIRPCRLYTNRKYDERTLVRNVPMGMVVHVVKVINIKPRHQSYEQTRLVLNNGDYITANKNFVKIFK